MGWARLMVVAGMLPLACSSGSSDKDPLIVFDPCSSLTVMPDAAANAAQRAGIVWALAMWQSVAHTRASTDPVAGAPELPVRFQAASLAFRGLYDDHLGVVFINQAILADHERAVTIAHEIGHAFGLEHVDPAARLSVMNPANATVEPTVEDAAELTSRWGRCETRADAPPAPAR